jgi:hypothetical protein
MKDTIQKKIGVPYSTSRSFEKAIKKKTQKARRQDGKRQIQKDHE